MNVNLICTPVANTSLKTTHLCDMRIRIKSTQAADYSVTLGARAVIGLLWSVQQQFSGRAKRTKGFLRGRLGGLG